MIELNHIPLQVTDQINYFRKFLIAAWPFLDKMMQNHDWDSDMGFTDDWMQANWEFLVERELLGAGNYLYPLRLGKRAVSLDVQPNYKIICQLKNHIALVDWIKKAENYQNEELLIYSFCAKYQLTFGLYPPFDFVKIGTLDRKKIYVVPFDECTFWLKSITP